MSKVGEIERKQYQNSDSINFSFDNRSLVIRNRQSVINKCSIFFIFQLSLQVFGIISSFSVEFCRYILFFIYFVDIE